MKVLNIFKKLPSDFTQTAVRDVSLPTSAVVVDIHAKELPQRYKTPFRAFFMFQYKNQAGIFRSIKDLEKFSSTLALKFYHNKNFTLQTCSALIKYTKKLLNFIKQNPKISDLAKNHKSFFSNYREFFTLHQIVQWGGDGLSKMNFAKKYRDKQNYICKILQKAYKFNEMAVPMIEKYFVSLKIQHLLPEEINENVLKNIQYKPKGRNVLSIKNKRIVLTAKQAKNLKDNINKLCDSKFKTTNHLKGQSVSKGVFKGKVRVITELKKLNQIKPGEILITTMTRPQYNPVIKKVGAIVTDEGGLISHAAILAREFKIPCLVGTRHATKIFKTGDLVEVNANIGTVKLIPKKIIKL